MPRKEWKSVSLPENIIEKIDEIIETKKYGWKSRANVVIYAVNRLLDNHGTAIKGGETP